MTSFTERVVKIILAIPPGKVMTYGQVARLAGCARGARQVVRILHSMSHKYGLPWHRVINSRGKISMKIQHKYDLQKNLLESEGIVFDLEDRINLHKYSLDFINY